MEHPNPPHNILSLILVALGFSFETLSALTIENVYTWSFRILSIISLVLVIIINFPKAKETLKSLKKDGNN